MLLLLYSAPAPAGKVGARPKACDSEDEPENADLGGMQHFTSSLADPGQGFLIV